MDIVERLDWLCTDWDRSQMVDGEPPLDDVRVGDLRKAAAEITRLRALVAEAERAKADAWDEAMGAVLSSAPTPTEDARDKETLAYIKGFLDLVEAIRALVNPYRSKTDG